MSIKVSILTTGNGPSFDVPVYLFGDGVSDRIVIDLTKFGYDFKSKPQLIQNGTIISSASSGANVNDTTFSAVAEMLDEKRLEIKFNKPLEAFAFSPFVSGGPGSAQFDFQLLFDGEE